MKSRILLIAVLGLLPVSAGAQGTVNDLGAEARGRISAGADYKLAKGLHLTAEGEFRLKDNFATVDRAQFTLGLNYKFTPWLKGGVGYTLIDNYKASSAAWEPRHRFTADLTETIRSGDWRFSFRERFQVTHKTGEVNRYQEQVNILAIKTRFKVSYKGFRTVEPYGGVELRTVFNDPAYSATYNEATGTYSDARLLGYTDTYLNRVRGTLGLKWNLSARHAIDLYLNGDYCYDKNLDTNNPDVLKDDGTVKTLKIKSLTCDRSFHSILGVGYTFSF